MKLSGSLVHEFHKFMSEDCEIVTRELDMQVEISTERDGIIRSRITGDEFGGCSMNPVYRKLLERILETCSRVPS